MQSVTCPSCRTVLKTRLRTTIENLRNSRRSFDSTSSIYWDTNPPIDRELAAARYFFQQHPPRKVWTATEWRKTNDEHDGLCTPEVAFLGRSNVGKSSLLNAVLGQKDLNRVGQHPGKTKVMHAWGLAASDPKSGRALRGWKGMDQTRVTVLDAPGYGYGSDRDWGAEIMTYLKRRKQLRRIFILIDAVHGPKKHDRQMLEMLREFSIPHQLIVSKVDRQKNLSSILQSLQEVAQPHSRHRSFVGLGEILAVGGLEESIKAKPLGVHDVQWAILRAAGLEDFAVNNFMRLKETDALKYAAVPREPNAESHRRGPHVLPPSPMHTPAEVLQAAPRGAPKLAETEAATEKDMTTSQDPESFDNETAPPAQVNPNVYRGMDAFAEATEQRNGTKSPPRTTTTTRRGGFAARDSRGRRQKAKR